MFDVIHELAVLGTTCFMMAVYVLYYAPVAAGRFVSIRPTEELTGEQLWLYRVRLFGLLLVSEVGVALVLACVTPLSSALVALGVGVFGSSLVLGALLVIDKRILLVEYVAHAGYVLVWLLGSILLLQYWPW